MLVWLIVGVSPKPTKAAEPAVGANVGVLPTAVCTVPAPEFVRLFANANCTEVLFALPPLVVEDLRETGVFAATAENVIILLVLLILASCVLPA